MTIASIDIGTNTVLLLIAKVDQLKTSFIPLLNEQRIPRIGKSLQPGEKISEQKIIELLKILEEYNQLIKKYNCDEILITATNAFRIASNAKEISSQIKDKFGYEINIISGKEEALLSYLGIVNNFENQKIVMIDIGGGSTEITYGEKNNILFSKSFNIGVVSGTENYLNDDPPKRDQVDKFILKLDEIFKELSQKNFNIENVIAIAGTPTTLACIKQNLVEYNEEKIEESYLNIDEIYNLSNQLSLLSSDQIKEKYKSIVKGREDILLAGTLILFKLLEIMNVKKVKVSTKGIRYGAVEKYLQTRKIK